MDEALKNNPTFEVLGVEIDLIHVEAVVDTIDRWIQEKQIGRFVVATGMHGIMESRRNPRFRIILDSADLFVPDGISLVWAARLRGRRGLKRVSGPDLMRACLKHFETRGYKHFFYGDTWDTLELLAKQLLSEHPGLEIAGYQSPPFRQLTPEEDEEEIRLINESGADMLWVGLGLPKQEQWIYEHLDRLEIPVCIGVGAAFKFLSGRVNRAPAWVGNNGFEWAWRLVQEPRLVGRRVFIDGTRFIGHLALEMMGFKKYL